MNPLHPDAPLSPALREPPASQPRSDLQDGRDGDLAWQRALEQASGPDYASWFKPVPAPATVAASAARRAPAAEQTTHAPAWTEPRMSPAPHATDRPAATRPQASQRQPGTVDVPADRQSAFVADVAAAWTQPLAARASVTPSVAMPPAARIVMPLGPGLAFDVPTSTAPTERAPADAGAPADRAVPAAGEPQPLRVHAQWSADGVSVWLGCDAGALPALDEFIAQLQRTLAARGERLARVVCNGREVWHAVPPSGLSSSFLPASSRLSFPSNRPYEAP